MKAYRLGFCTRIAIATIATTLLAACGTDTAEWKKEVLLHDGRMIAIVLNDTRWVIQAGADALDYTAPADNKSDVILGFSGNDDLRGGAGADILVAGSGIDVLDGGAGNDKLYGGADFDFYTFTDSSWGHDIVIDSDGQGHLRLGGTVLGACHLWPGASSVWLDATDTYLLTKIARADGSADLVIARKDAPGAATITIRNWSDTKNLGITLEPAPVVADAPAAPSHPGVYMVSATGTAVMVGTDGDDRLIANPIYDNPVAAGSGASSSGWHRAWAHWKPGADRLKSPSTRGAQKPQIAAVKEVTKIDKAAQGR